jgi:UDP-glucose 4-epimerase
MIDSIAGETVLVTGATGFIGSHLCSRLVQMGCEVHGLSRKARKRQVGVRCWAGDIADFETLRNIVSTVKPEYIFHLAAEVTGERSLEMMLPTLRSNLTGTVNLLTAAAESMCRRIVLAGSLEEPGDAQMIPCSPYAAAKGASSVYARMFHSLYQLPVATARLFMVYGPGQEDSNKLIPYVTLCLLRGESPQLGSGGRPVDWIYVSDVVEGLLATAMTPKIDGATVDLGSGTLVTVRAVVETLAALVDSPAKPMFGARPDRPLERIRHAQLTATQAAISWRPEVDLREGLRKTVEWYREQLAIFRPQFKHT